ncbi:hypothetical protein HY250_01995 [Candidatus Azambacteria bacterium]|nr:hypothetical protein [Candidatus Azambacteria bacterium]
MVSRTGERSSRQSAGRSNGGLAYLRNGEVLVANCTKTAQLACSEDFREECSPVRDERGRRASGALSLGARTRVFVQNV